MDKVKLFSQVLLFTTLAGSSFVGFMPASEGCNGCNRRAVVKQVHGLDMDHFTIMLAEAATSPCFHLVYTGEINEPGAFTKWKPPEYYFTGSYETNLNGPINSRFSISLYFENGELVHTWKTESENPNFTWNAHRNTMFRNRNAEFRKSVPLDIHMLNEFEKQPYRCEVTPDKQELYPGQETRVKISGIVDLTGAQSREFNRILVQAAQGEIKGGTPLEVDPDIKAFQVGDGEITFTYVAPEGDVSQANEDNIFVYNSCDILRADEYPLTKTELKSKIAEKKIKLNHADTEVTITATYTKHSKTHEEEENSTDDTEQRSEISMTIKAFFEYDGTSRDEGEYEEQYKVKSWEISSFNGNSESFTRHFDWNDACQPTRCTFERIQVTKATALNFRKEEGSVSGMSIVFNAKTNRATQVTTGSFPVLYSWTGQMKETETYVEPSGTRKYHDQYDIHQEGFFSLTAVGPFPEFTKVMSGDGIHTIGGRGEHSFTPGYDQLTVTWVVKRNKN